MSFFLPKHFFFLEIFYLLNGNQYRKNVTNALPDPSRGQTRVSISSITPTAMQGPRDKACPLGDFHGIHSSTERHAWGKTSQSARCEALGQCTKLTPPLLLLRFHSLKPVFTEHLRGAGHCARLRSNTCSPAACNIMACFQSHHVLATSNNITEPDVTCVFQRSSVFSCFLLVLPLSLYSEIIQTEHKSCKNITKNPCLAHLLYHVLGSLCHPSPPLPCLPCIRIHPAASSSPPHSLSLSTCTKFFWNHL